VRQQWFQSKCRNCSLRLALKDPKSKSHPMWVAFEASLECLGQ
jgi:hypothetical protein